MTVIATLLKTKAWYLQSQINEKDRNSLIEQSIHMFLKTAINSNIAGFFLYNISSTKIAIPPSPTCNSYGPSKKFESSCVRNLDITENLLSQYIVTHNRYDYRF